MCSQAALKEITSKVVQAAKDSLGDKLDKVILYGSYARGDYDDESDIDIMVLADIPADTANKLDMEMCGLANQLGLKHDILVSLFIKDCATFYKFLCVEPFYQNIIQEGVLLSA